MEKGETPKEAVVRETFEELNYKLKNPKLVLIKKSIDKKYNYIITENIFIENYDKKQKLIQNEGDKMGWFSFEDSDNLDIIEVDKKALSLIKEKNLIEKH